ncbi:hypothetical protein [Parabacteroides sp.]
MKTLNEIISILKEYKKTMSSQYYLENLRVAFVFVVIVKERPFILLGM